MNDYYNLDINGEPITENNKDTWYTVFSNPKRVVGSDIIGKSKISTVFLCLNHNFGNGAPILWETLVFGGKLNGEQDRCSGMREDAIKMHRRMIDKVKNHNKT